jgi:hypothetical protein
VQALQIDRASAAVILDKQAREPARRVTYVPGSAPSRGANDRRDTVVRVWVGQTSGLPVRVASVA